MGAAHYLPLWGRWHGVSRDGRGNPGRKRKSGGRTFSLFRPLRGHLPPRGKVLGAGEGGRCTP